MTATHPIVVRAADQAEYWFDEGCHIAEWLNVEADPSVSVARARVPPRSTTRWHRLSATVERYVILSGRGRVALRGEAGLEADLGPGDVVVIPAGTDQRITNAGDEDLVFLAICTPRFRPVAYRDTDDGSAAESDPAGSGSETR
jgi:mannose-6-phosphate isomerase-like protein (cupin superfamily)